MFFRQKRSGDRVYLQIVENRWEKGRTKQRVVATVGHLDQLQQSGQLSSLQPLSTTPDCPSPHPVPEAKTPQIPAERK